VNIGVVSASRPVGGDRVGQLDGFGERWSTVLAALEQDHSVHLVHLAADAGDGTPGWTAGRPIQQLTAPARPGTRIDRAARLARRNLGRHLPTGWERGLVRELRAAGCDAVVLLTHRRPDAARVVARRFPTVLFAEEDVAEGPDGWGRACGPLVSLEAAALRRAVAPVGCVAVIGPGEVRWAEQAYGRPTVVVPHSIDAARWSQGGPPHPTERPEVLVMGNFAAARNAEGLRLIADEVGRRPPGPRRPVLRVVSAAPPHPLLAELERSGAAVGALIEWIGPVPDPLPLYKSAPVTLVPAREVRGVKTTILQGWATGCPVVATSASAASVGGRDGVDLLCHDDPAAVVDRIETLLSDVGLQERLRRNGRKAFESRHGPGAVHAAVTRAVELAAGPGRLDRLPAGYYPWDRRAPAGRVAKGPPGPA
jgi:glycosyltransferase involved in cell wall biosynthesis